MPGPFVSSPQTSPLHPSGHATRLDPLSGRDLDNSKPGVPGLSKWQTSDGFFKPLSVADHEISESSLGKGFAFGFKKPPCPGQFSGRPLFPFSDANKPTNAASHVELPQKHPQRPAAPAVGSAAGRRGGPLLLDELSLPTSKAISTTPPRRDGVYSKLTGMDFLGADNHVSLVESLHHQTSDELTTPASESRRRPGASNKRQRDMNEDAVGKLLSKSAAAEEILGHQLVKPPEEVIDGQEMNARVNNVNASSSGSAGREQAVGFKTPEMHDRGMEQLFQRSSPASTCGDLERPAHRSPKRRHQPAAQGSALLRASPHFGAARRNRSQSRTSNISKKRSEDHKHRRRTEDERKKKAMQHVAQYWNECIQISEDEKKLANREIEHLQHQLQRQALKLTESRSALSQKQQELESAESQKHQLEEEGFQMTEENKRLKEEAQTLRGQLSDSNTQATKFREKHRQIRDKLNEAIQEQQTLFRRSQAFYEDSMAELRKEQEERKSYTSKMDQALETSRHKREEMKRCFDEFRDKMERESRLREDTILQLRSRIEEQEQSLLHERSLTESLRQQADMQRDSQNTMRMIASNMESFLQDYAVKHRDQQESTRIVENISERHYLQSSEAGDKSSPVIVTQAIKGMEELISRRVVTVVADLATNQGRMEGTLLSLGQNCGIQVQKIREYLEYQNDEVLNGQRDVEKIGREFRSSLESLQSEVETARETCQEIKQAVKDGTQTELVVRQEEMLTRQADLDAKLAERDERVGQLEHQLRSLSQTYTKEIAALTEVPSCGEEKLQSKLDSVVAEFRGSLEKGFLQEKSRSEEHLRQTQTAMAALECQLRAVVDQLAVARSSTPSEDNVDESQLEQQRQNLEKQTKAGEALRGRWQQDIKAVDALRAQLQELQRRVPQMERLDSTLGKMAQMNEILHSTAEYLTREQDWARQQIDRVADADSGRHEAQVSDQEQRRGAEADADFACQVLTLESEVTDDAQQGGTLLKRKVTVYSPAGTALSPSPPPSVEQEQARRRGAAQPRSILKLSAMSSLEAARTEGEKQSQHSRPMTGRDSVVEQIRAELLPSKASQLAWSLPSVADFERDGLGTLLGRKAVDKAKRRLEDVDGIAETANKKAKSDARCPTTGRG
ncbi:hypothetical protein CP532_6038 [Ophiocordyceps camponoti-leonardi (nom. inval.)]|nr:hypothetical protein CP532_6038 [Ophiocordyceps camponoti-leonardi (nom. inval.)]